jgi:plastocyanin
MSLQPHPRRTAARALTAGLLALALLAGACGGDDDDDASAAPQETTTSTAGTISTEASAATATTATTATTVTTTTATTAVAPAAGAIKVQGFTFLPASLAVKAGTAVTWTNRDQIQHTATSGTSVSDASGTYTGTPDGTFNGDMAEQGKTFSFTFATPGTYKYFCNRHNSMVGEVVVS